MVRGLVLVCSSAALGMGLVGLWAGRPGRLGDSAAKTLRLCAVWCLLAALVLQFVQLHAHGAVLLAGSGNDGPVAGAEPVKTLWAAGRTHVGSLMWGQAALLAVACAAAALGVWAVARARLAAGGMLVLAVVLSFACAALSGHVPAASGSVGLSAVAVLHVVLAGLWLGGLPALWLLWLQAQRRAAARPGPPSEPTERPDVQALRIFSRFALPSMGLVLGSGVLLANETVARWAALVATPYGWLMMGKLVLLALALACAWVLRSALGGAPGTVLDARANGRWLALEGVLACGVAVSAGTLASWIPAAHQSFDWPFSFRVAPEAAWLQRQDQIVWPLAAAAALAVVGVGLATASWRRRRRFALLTGAGCMGAGLALAVPALSVEAYPSSYHASAAPYDAESIAAGARLYATLCVQCHGAGGNGDGPLARGLNPPPADLTAPHLGWHLHGDMYWWITRGFAGSAMPGFEDRTTQLQRWHIINHLMALSTGYQARSLGEGPVPRAPWLPSINFRYPRADGQYVQLSELQLRSPVLLVFISDPAELPRLDELARQARELSHTGLAVIAVLSSRLRGPAGAVPGVDVVVDEAGEIQAAWSHYRRTLGHPDFRNERPEPPRLEMLVDRYGYVRARWRSDEGAGQAGTEALRSALATFAREPEFPVADAHAH